MYCLSRLIGIVALGHVLVACSSSGSDPAPVNNTLDDPDTGNSDSILQEGLIGPVGGSGADGEYSQFNDSPFANLDFSSGYFYLEDFEDGVFEHPGASASSGNFVTLVFGDTFNDSVDADDGLLDGDSVAGESWFHDDASVGVTWTFNADELNGQLPTHAGLVWTDGRGETTFEAFDLAGGSLGVIRAVHDNSSFNGETNEDRFYGVVNYSGISAIKIVNDNRLNGIEIDHLQWGFEGN